MVAINSAQLINLVAAPFSICFYFDKVLRDGKLTSYFLSHSVPKNPTQQPVWPSLIPLVTHSSHWLLLLHMGYCAAPYPGALSLIPFLTNRDLISYLWMRDPVSNDPPSTVWLSEVAAQVCSWSRPLTFLK